MTDFDELKQTKAQCLADITEALPDYVNRLNSVDNSTDLHGFLSVNLGRGLASIMYLK